MNPLSPQKDHEILIDGSIYTFAEHPSAPGMPYGQEGRAGTVYQLLSADGAKALKVFKPRFCTPSLVYHAEQIAKFAALPGLQVCQRTVLTPSRHVELLRQHPDLTYAVLMPWVEGETWQEVMLEKAELSTAQALGLARGLCKILVGLEERGIAHCDLSGPNLLVKQTAVEQSELALVDVEGMYAPDLIRPEVLPAGSPGYAHKTAPNGLWGPQADRFAGAVLLAEMLGWCDPAVRQAAWGENYFDPAEMQRDGGRYRKLEQSISANWGEGVANLLRRAWQADSLGECPTFGIWMVALPEQAPAQVFIQGGAGTTGTQSAVADMTNLSRELLETALELERDGEHSAAAATLRRALTACPADSGMRVELQAMLAQTEARLKPPAARPESAQPPGQNAPRACPACGKPIPGGMDTCPHCEGQSSAIPAPRKPARGKWALIIGMLILFLLFFSAILEGLQGRGMLSNLANAKPTATLTSTLTLLPTSTRTATPPLTPTITQTLIMTLTPTFTLTPIPTFAPGATQVSPKDGMVLVYVPAGEFLMGSTYADKDANSDEKPQHSVYLDAFWIDQTEVTNAMFARFLNESGKANVIESGVTWLDSSDYDAVIHQVYGKWQADQGYAEHPAREVTWFGAQAYCTWAGRQLPTEAQWEKAARGIDGRLYPWGNQAPDDTFLNFLYRRRGTTAVKSYEKGKSPYGAYDMAGNVREWVADWYSETTYSSQSTWRNPPGPSSGDYRVFRGGSWDDDSGNVRAAIRDCQEMAFTDDSVGFRCGR